MTEPLDQTLRSPSSSTGTPSDADVLRAEGDARYHDLRELGVGGMGEVRLVKDLRLSREVALKRMRGALDSPDDARRFLREVRVQGQLDHPAVVPVYDLGLGPDGNPWFTMKRVRGQTLYEVLHLLKRDDAATVARYGRWRLLSVFITICQCVDSAHARGVLHRDLKPGNVMLGEFGEVHVLDWGLARVLGKDKSREQVEVADTRRARPPDTRLAVRGAPDQDLRRGDREPSSVRPVEVAPDHGTELGVAMGTPGYMSPEQADGLVDQLDARTDVYALGVILHELLFLSPVHDQDPPQELINLPTSSPPGASINLPTSSPPGASINHPTSSPPGASINTRRVLPAGHRADVAPELDAIWRKACAATPGDRFPSARALADAVERFLEGERDDARRHELAAEQLRVAEQALTDTHEGRGRALQALGRALALDPTNAAALRRLSALLSDPPKETPPEAQARLAALALTRAQAMLRATAVRLGTWALGVALAAGLLGAKSAPLLACVLTLLVTSGAAAFLLSRRVDAVERALPVGLLGVACIAVLSLTLGPLVVVPTLASTHAMLFAANAPLATRRWMVLASLLAVLLPALLTPLGDYVVVTQGALTLSSPLLVFDSPATTLVILLFSLGPVVTPALLVGELRDAFVEAERGVVVQVAALQQLIPD